MNETQRRVVLVEHAEERREILARRLRAQGYSVECAADAAIAANMALEAPPDAVIADLWMPSISGIQLCRLLRAEPATADVPVVLRGEDDDPRSRFWAERAGATAYVPKGRIGDLMRALSRAIDAAPKVTPFFMQLSGGIDIRDRIARHLDAALFDSVIASEVRGLSNCGSFDRLFDAFSQFLSQLIGYRWLSLVSYTPERAAIHHHPLDGVEAEREARIALELDDGVEILRVTDEDARAASDVPTVIVCPVRFGNVIVGKFAISPLASNDDVHGLVTLVAREFGGAIRMTALVEESERLASTDPLTGAMNRRAFGSVLANEVDRSRRYAAPMSLLLLDVDHFKTVNDRRGHAAGDALLVHLATMLKRQLRGSDAAARWGGEEFVVVLPGTPVEGAGIAAERLRRAIEAEPFGDGRGGTMSVTLSIGVTSLSADDTIESLVERADVAMYAAKERGRNRVVVAGPIEIGVSRATCVSIRPERERSAASAACGS